MVTLWTNCPSTALAHLSFHFYPKRTSHALKLQCKPVSQERTVRRLALKKMCSWFELKVDAADETSFSSKISEGPKTSDELVFSRSWTKALSLHALLQPQIQMETALTEQQVFLGQDPFKLQVDLERRSWQWRNLGVDQQGISQASSTTSKSWTQILGAANAELVCHLHIWMREIKLHILFFSELVFSKSDLDSVTDPAGNKAPCKCWLTSCDDRLTTALTDPSSY